YLSIFERREERHFTSVMRGINGYCTRQNLAAVYTQMEKLAQAEEQLRLVVQEVPRYRQGWRLLGENLLRQGNQEAARALVEELWRDAVLRPEGAILKSRLAEGLGDLAGARAVLEQAVAESPKDRSLLDSLCRFLF